MTEHTRTDGLPEVGEPQVLERARPRSERMAESKIECNACPVLCQISEGKVGACDRYANQSGVLVRVDPTRREELVGTALAVHTEAADTDGWLRLEMTFQDARHAEWALWQLGLDAEALAPQWLRTTLANRATALAIRYGVSGRALSPGGA